MRQTMIKALRGLDPVAIENAARFGTPDVNYIEGWIENKWKPGWPVRPKTPLRVETFTQPQRLWMRRRALAGGKIHLLLKVGREWLLLPPVWASLHLGEKTQEELKQSALAYWPKSLNPAQLVETLRSPMIPEIGVMNSFLSENAIGFTVTAATKINTKPRNVLV